MRKFIILIIAVMFTGCVDGEISEIDPNLNGIWVNQDEDTYFDIFIFDNGNFEAYIEGHLDFSGTYYTEKNKLTLEIKIYKNPDMIALGIDTLTFNYYVENDKLVLWYKIEAINTFIYYEFKRLARL